MPKEASTKSKAKKAAEKPARGKGKKDPNAPKRALSAYMFFSQDWRERIKAENPDAGFGEVGKLLGAKWKELDESEKKPYIEQAARDKARAEEEKANYDVGTDSDTQEKESGVTLEITVTYREKSLSKAGSGGDEDDDE